MRPINSNIPSSYAYWITEKDNEEHQQRIGNFEELEPVQHEDVSHLTENERALIDKLVSLIEEENSERATAQVLSRFANNSEPVLPLIDVTRALHDFDYLLGKDGFNFYHPNIDSSDSDAENINEFMEH